MFKKIIHNLIKKNILESNLTNKNELESKFLDKINVFSSKIKERGDYSTNAAFILSENLKTNPQETALKLVEFLKENKQAKEIFEKIEVAGSGFINFFINKDYLKSQFAKIAKKPDKLFDLKLGKNQKIQVEFISANPTGELHLGHGRGAFFGDVLANIYQRLGYKTEREYFINDAKESLQIKELGKTALGKGTSYLTDYLKSKIKNQKSKIESKIKKLRKSKNLEGEIGYLMAQEIQKDNQKFIKKKLKIKFNNFFSEEKKLYKTSQIKKTLDLLKKKKLIYKKDGALWLKTKSFGDNEDRVIVRSSGEPTYFLSDIAYHKNKFDRKYRKIIDIWGADHQGHQKRMLAIKKILNYKGDLNILISQLVTLKSRGKIEKFSKRKGKIITLNWLIDKIGLDVARFFYLMKSLDTHMEFDLDLALEQSEKNPVFYIQYAYVRAKHILEKSKTKSYKPTAKSLELLNHELELNLISKILKLPEILEEISKNYQVHDLAHYALDLAADFHRFYKFLPVLNAENKNLILARLSLVASFKIILENIFGILGIKSPEKM